VFLTESIGSIFVIAERDGWANALRFDAKNDPSFGRTLKYAAWLENKRMVGLLQAYPTFEEFKNAVLTPGEIILARSPIVHGYRGSPYYQNYFWRRTGKIRKSGIRNSMTYRR
jgi:hypothetical protein